MIMNLLIMKPCFNYQLSSVHNCQDRFYIRYHGDYSQRNLNDTNDFLSAKGKLDDDEEADWRDSDDYESIDSEGRSHKTYHGDSQQN